MTRDEMDRLLDRFQYCDDDGHAGYRECHDCRQTRDALWSAISRGAEAEAKLAAVEARLAEMQNDFGRGWHDACDEIGKALGVSHGA